MADRRHNHSPPPPPCRSLRRHPRGILPPEAPRARPGFLPAPRLPHAFRLQRRPPPHGPYSNPERDGDDIPHPSDHSHEPVVGIRGSVGGPGSCRGGIGRGVSGSQPWRDYAREYGEYLQTKLKDVAPDG
ncbi:hypothetical protein MLD38_026206 [Melastoma candidum]|uniref:Uncharacterized protein n=1 Tax=Melastoma candidum TaxID=119954 RepID=A0ACB9NXV3_9MYRT|nr:hypothetical protein MLD38_026206 [Melastoma candidum]